MTSVGSSPIGATIEDSPVFQPLGVVVISSLHLVSVSAERSQNSVLEQSSLGA